MTTQKIRCSLYLILILYPNSSGIVNISGYNTEFVSPYNMVIFIRPSSELTRNIKKKLIKPVTNPINPRFLTLAVGEPLTKASTNRKRWLISSKEMYKMLHVILYWSCKALHKMISILHRRFIGLLLIRMLLRSNRSPFVARVLFFHLLIRVFLHLWFFKGFRFWWADR